MKKFLLILAVLSFIGVSGAYAGSIQYIGNGKGEPVVKISYSRNNGANWEHKTIKPGQTFQVPKDATNLVIDNTPRNPKQNFKVKDGNVF